MRRYILSTLVVTGAAAAAAPAASARTTVPIDASYSAKIAGPNDHPSCPGNEFLCGSGLDRTFGAFTLSAVLIGTQTTTLTFVPGALVIDETFGESTPPGNSGSSHQPLDAHGHPGTYLFNWTVDSSSSGVFLNATGGGTDVVEAASEAAKGVISGTLNLS
jgi:hypothetical protein